MLDPIPTSKDEMSSAAIATQTTFERWTADPSRTTVEFELGHLWGLHTVRGRFRSFDGAYVVGRGGSEIELTIDAASVDIGCVARDKNLRSADFFDANQHPQDSRRRPRSTRAASA